MGLDSPASESEVGRDGDLGESGPIFFFSNAFALVLVHRRGG